MDYAVQFQINIFALMILLVLYLIMKTQAKVKSTGKQLLKAVMAASAAAIIIEPLTWIFDGKQFFGAFTLEYGTNVLLFMMGPILGGLLLSYVDYRLFRSPARLKKKGYYQHASVLTALILLVNVFYPLYFTVDAVTNSYSSGDFKEVHYVVLASMYIYMFFFITKHHKKTNQYVVNIFLLFFALPIAGMIVQLFDSKLYFSWTSTALGILVAYVFLESSSSEEDFLTRLYNRKSYDLHTANLLELQKPFQVILIDLNHFKEINDTYGHDKGDELLIRFAGLLKTVFSKKALVSRLGGDEFMIVLEDTAVYPEKKVQELGQLLLKQKDPFLSRLTFSWGTKTWQPGITQEMMYKAVDKQMYEHKYASKRTDQG
ncbi:GGDEF domain-containing protein [Alkalicoccus urumqiensis]|uniref:GGDEF domain-containing protein n=1 Tax=Alkalicoccus urumqiensis TaxID=1548213 RepID=A0A2P6MIU1_ALKUR|nr:GGDEF domain-containing protein [Alkalicoccus urumqiensis]PRO66192.1 GGDEF domain-containing protein [Alkalicoccus urumqiensis]